MEIVYKKPKHLGNEGQQKNKFQIAAPDNRLRDINGNLCPMVVNMLNDCIRQYRAISKRQVVMGLPVTHAVKTIFLKPRLYNQFEYWYKSMLPERQADAFVNMLTFLDVEIKRASVFSTKEFYIEFYPFKKNMA